MNAEKYQIIEALKEQIKGDFSERDAEIYKRIRELQQEEQVTKPEGSAFECFGCGS